MKRVCPVTIALIVVNVVLFIPEFLQIPVGGYELNYWLAVTGDSLSRPWELVTAMFAHWTWDHLVMNMISLWWLGSLIEQFHGKLKFLVLYFVSGIAGNLAVVYFAPDTIACGASGAIFGLLAAAAVLFYSMRKDPVMRAELQGLLVMLGINVLNSFLPGISMAAHFGGLAAGAVCEAIFVALYKRGSDEHLQG